VEVESWTACFEVVGGIASVGIAAEGIRIGVHEEEAACCEISTTAATAVDDRVNVLTVACGAIVWPW
jgi:hypothetical protein